MSLAKSVTLIVFQKILSSFQSDMYVCLYFIVLFRCIDGTGQLNFGFAADAISNNDHFLTYSLGPQYNGMESINNDCKAQSCLLFVKISSLPPLNKLLEFFLLSSTGILGFPIDGQGTSVGQ